MKLFEKYGIHFKDDSLIKVALTHTSYANEHHMKKLSDLMPESHRGFICMNIDQSSIQIENVSIIAFHMLLSFPMLRPMSVIPFRHIPVGTKAIHVSLGAFRHLRQSVEHVVIVSRSHWNRERPQGS